MSVLRRMLGVEHRDVTMADVWARSLDWMHGDITRSGRMVNDQSALTLGAVYGCLRILSDGVAVLPPVVTRGSGAEAEPIRRPPSWVNDPNPYLRRVDVVRQIMLSCLLRGEGFVATPRAGSGQVLELWPLDPDIVEVIEDPRRAIRIPRYRIGDTEVGPMDLLHIRGMTMPGSMRGVSPITAARETIGLGLAAQEFGGAFFGNGARPGGVVEVPGAMSATAVKLMRATWNETHKGAGNSNKLAFLTEGATYKPITVNPDDAQFLETRAFQVADIARFFGVPPHLLADSSGSTSWGSGLAEQNTAYVTHSLRPWVQNLEEAFTWLIRSEFPAVDDSRQLYVTLDLDDLTRGDFSSRVATYRSGVESGIFTLNEVRRWEGLPPVDPAAPSTDRTMDIAVAAQRIYLAVTAGVMTAAEARELLNRLGAELPEVSP